jgi:WD40 repeat protein
MCPHSHPLDELEVALLRLSANPNLKLSEQLQRDERGLLRAARLALPDAHSQLLLVVDQFEELFTLADRTEARHFMNLLYQAVTDPHRAVRVVLTLRADFYDRPLMEQEFSALVQKRTEAVVPLSGEELERAVRCPAERVGVAFEAGLVTEIVAQVVEQAGALPLLQYALTELFEMRAGRTLTQAGYQAIGGVLGALWGRAETVYQGLDEAQHSLARQIFLRLVALGEGVEDSRRRVLVSELSSLFEWPLTPVPYPLDSEEDRGDGIGDLDTVLDAFGKARLLTFDHDPGTRTPTVEVAHEALIKEWDRLKDWLEASRADIRLQRLLASSAAEWQASGKDPSFLLRGSRLGQFEEWAGTASLALTGEERSYLQASLAERKREDAQEAARRANEIRLERRSRKFLSGLVAVFAVAAVVALGLTWLARRAQNQAVAEANSRATQQAIAESEAAQRATQQAVAEGEARGRATQQAIAEDAQQDAGEQRHAALLQASAGLAAQALAELDGAKSERSVLLALEALENYPYTPQAETALAQAVLQVYPYQELFPGIEAYPDALYDSFVFTPDDRQLIVYLSGYDTSWITSLEAASGEISRVFQLDSFCDVSTLALSPDGKYVTVLYQNDPACPFSIWDLERGKKLLTLSDQPELAAYDAAWAPDGRFILTGSLDDVARVWDAASGEVVQQFSGNNGPVRAVGWSPDGERLATGGEDGTLRLWDAQSGEQISSAQGHIGPVLSLDWSPSGELLASGGADGVAQVWDAATGQVRCSLRGHTDQISAVAWSAAGDRLATGGEDGTTRVWNPLTGEQLNRMASYPRLTSLDWSSQGDRLVNGTLASLRIWDMYPRTVRLVGHTGISNDAQWSPDGRQIATAGKGDGTVRIWGWPGGKLIRTLDDLPAGGYYLAWSPDGRMLAIATDMAGFSVWNTATWQRLWELPGSADDWPFMPGWSPDGSRLAVAGAPGYYALVLDAETGKVLTRIDSDRPGWLCLRSQSWAPQGDRFIAGTLLFNDDKTPARVWNAASGAVLLELPEQEGNTVMGAYSPDGRYIATISTPGVVRVWDAGSGQSVSPAVSLSGQTIDLHWSPNGERIAVGNADGVVIVLEALTGAQVASYPVSPPSLVDAVDWSPDGKSLLVLVNDNLQPYIFPAWQTTEDLIAYAKECCVWRELTSEERTQFGLQVP